MQRKPNVSITAASSSDFAIRENATGKTDDSSCKKPLTPSARRAFDVHSDQIVREFFEGRPMAILRTQFGMKQHELEQLFRNRMRSVA